jgi:AcrR family transcriptional regulator
MSTSENIVDAAMVIVREQGVARLTLDAAAKRAGLSKGGVLYHFKTKDDLIRGMVQRLIDRCEELSLFYYAQEPEGPYRWARAVVRSCFDSNGPANDPIGGALLAVVSVNPALIQPIRTMYDLWDERVRSDSPDPERASLICMAMDGMVFEGMMGLINFDEQGAERLKQTALALLT